MGVVGHTRKPPPMHVVGHAKCLWRGDFSGAFEHSVCVCVKFGKCMLYIVVYAWTLQTSKFFQARKFFNWHMRLAILHPDHAHELQL